MPPGFGLAPNRGGSLKADQGRPAARGTGSPASDSARKKPGDAKEAAPNGNHPKRNRASPGKTRGGAEGIGRGIGKRLGKDARRKAAKEALSARSPAHPAEKQGAKAKGRLHALKEKDAAATIWDPYPEV